MVLIEHAKRNEIDYDSLIKRCTIKMPGAQRRGQVVDISVIIPVQGRTEYHKIITEYFFAAIHNFKGNVALTFVEHDNLPPKHYWLTKSWVNHIFIPADGQKFNKCLCHNIGVLYGPKADYYLFHDTDIVVPVDFFTKLKLNIKGRDCIQGFTKRRLLMASESVTKQFLNGQKDVDFNNYSTHEISPALAGAPGGSIFIEKKMLFKVGLWDDVFFSGYSVEDQFFLNKVMLMGRFSSSDAPAIELIHLWHSRTYQAETSQQEFSYLHTFDGAPEGQRREYIAYREQYFKSIYNETHGNKDS